MPWWGYAYVAGYLAFAAWWVRDDIKEQRSIWFLLAEVVSDILLVLVALAYWHATLRSVIHPFRLPLFCAGVAWLVVEVPSEFRKHLPDPELSTQGNILVAICGLLLATLILGPLLYWGFSYAVLGKTVP